MNSSVARNQLFAKAKSSAGINNINAKEICSVNIWVPGLDEQNQIVDIIDKLLINEQQAKEISKIVLDKIAQLKMAIIDKFFKGEIL